jgi:hypothetical protein
MDSEDEAGISPRRFECSIITFFVTVLLGALNFAF